MKTRKKMILLCAAVSVVLSGCNRVHINLPGSASSKQAEATATPTPTQEPQPTAVPAEVTVTPMPTSTPAPRRIGTKTSTAKYIYLTNSLSLAIRELYLRENGTTDWGKNLIASESSVKSAETAQMFYSLSAEQYDIRVVDKSGNSYALYYVPLGDMESGVLRKDSDGLVYLYYTSLTSGQQEQNSYSEILAMNYSDSLNSDSSYDSSEDWEVYYYDNSENSYDSDGWYSYDYDDSSEDGSSSFYIEDYDPTKDYSEYEGNYNYGYYNDYGNWISYY